MFENSMRRVQSTVGKFLRTKQDLIPLHGETNVTVCALLPHVRRSLSA